MRSRYLTFAVFLLALAPPGRAETLSRAGAVRAALQANPEVLKSRAQLNYLDGRITEEKAAALPEINARGTTYRYNDPSFLNSPTFDSFAAGFGGSLRPIPGNIFEGALEVRQTLYSFKIGRAIRAARLAKQVGGADLRRVQQQIALETVQAYNALLYAGEQVRVQQNALSQKEQHLEITRNRREAGVATELDVLRAQVSVENQRAEVTRAEGGVELARAQLNALMLRPMDSPITPSDTLSYQPADYLPENVMREALANRPDLQVAEFTQGVRAELVGLARADHRPSFEFVGNYGRSTRKPENFLDTDFSKWTAAVNVKIPLFDGNRTAGKVLQAEAEVAKARQDTAALENKIRLEAMNALVNLNVAARLIRAAQLNVDQAQRALGMTQANYKYGAATQLDVTDAETALVQAEITLAQALEQHANACATISYVMGRDPAGTSEVSK
jgi:outer membrane protein TolC